MELSGSGDELQTNVALDIRAFRTRAGSGKGHTSEDEDEDFEDDEIFKDDEEDDDDDAIDKGSDDEGSSAEDDDDEEDEDDDEDSTGDLTRLSLSSVSLITRVRQEEGSFFSLLPAELRLNILSFLGPSQLAKIRLVSHQWRELAEDDRLWRKQHQELLGGPLVLKYSKNPIRKQVERNKKKEMLLLRQEQRQRKKDWADKRRLWARRERARHKEEKEKEHEKEEHREDREQVVREFVASVINHEQRRRGSAEQIGPHDTTDASVVNNTEAVIKYAIREGMLNEEEIVEHKVKRVKDRAREIKEEIKALDENLQVLGIQEKQGAAPDFRWVEGYCAFGRYIKKIAHAAQMKESKEAQKKQEAQKKHAEAKSPTLTRTQPPVIPPSALPYSAFTITPMAVSPRAAAGENMRMRQFKALEEKEKKKDKKEKKEKEKKEKREKRSRSTSETRKAQEKKAGDKIDVYGKLKRQRSRTTDDIEPAIQEARELRINQDDLKKRSALGRVSASPAGQGIHRQRSLTTDHEDHLERLRKAEKQREEEEEEKIKEKERKALAKIEKAKGKAKRKEVDFWSFWDSISRSVQAWILMTAASFGHRKFLERLYVKLKEDKTVGKLLVPIFHQLLHAACQQGQPETAEFLLHVKLEFKTDRRIAHSPAFKHMEHQLQVARWDAFRTASKWGHTKLIEILLSHGYQPDERAVRGAIVGGQLEILKLLISYGADIKPLHMKRAIYYRNKEIVAHLLDLFPHLPQAEPYLLKIAVSTRANFRQAERLRNRTIPKFVDFGIIDLLLAHGADINDNSDVHYAPSPLHIAAQQGNPDLCEFLLEKGADMHGIFSCPMYAVSNPLLHKTRGLVLTLTPFEVAVYNGRERVVEYFLAKASASSHPLTEISKLFCKPEPRKQPKTAILFRPVDLASLREARDGDAAGKVTSPRDKPKLTTILHQPEELDQVPNIKNIFKIFRAYRVNLREIESHVAAYLPALSPLHHAAKNDNLAGILSMLVEMGLNREKRDKKGRTPLLKAARFCSTENIQVLLKHQAVIDAIDCEGNSAFHHLIIALPSMPSFLSASAPLSVTGQPSRSPTKVRAAHGHSLPLGSSPPSLSHSASSSSSSSSSSSGGSPLAAQEPSPARVMNGIKALIDSGGDINMINNLDETCLDLLARKSKKYCPGKNDVTLFLKAHGAKSGKELVHSGKSKGKLRGLLGL